MNHHDRLSDGPHSLTGNEMESLWELFSAIHRSWGSEACRPEDMASQWREFVQLKVSNSPSYLEHYRQACKHLDELRQKHGDRLYQYLLLEGELHRLMNSRFAALKRYVVDEFIRVYVSLGGFRSFGGKNYSGYVAGSRYRSQRPYRTYEDV